VYPEGDVEKNGMRLTGRKKYRNLERPERQASFLKSCIDDSRQNLYSSSDNQ
jgi:hypothetical protein